MKLVFSVLIALAINIQMANAQQCATFEFEQTEKEIISLNMVNYQLPKSTYDMHDLLTKTADYQIAPGDHLLSAISFDRALVKQNSYLKVKGAKAKNANHVYMEAFYNFEANNHYVFGKNPVTHELMLKNKVERKCHRKTAQPLIESPSTTITMSKLPADLEQMLKELRMKMYRFYQSNNQQLPLSNIDILKADEYFGTVTANSFTNNNYIQLLSVLPKSSAYKFGLRSGDIITKLGNSELDVAEKTPIAVLDAYLKYSKNLTVTVLRQGKEHVIKGKYKVNVVPSSIYTVGGSEGLYNTSFNRVLAFPEDLQFLYERATIALSDYYKSRGITTDFIQVYRPAEKIVSLGLEGVLVKGEGVKVELLANDSPLKPIGIVQGDVITEFDGISLQNSISNLVKAVNSLNEGETISFTVKRNGYRHNLQGKYQQPEIPMFNILVNLKSEELALALLEKTKSQYPRHPFRRGYVGGSEWKNVHPDKHIPEYGYNKNKKPN